MIVQDFITLAENRGKELRSQGQVDEARTLLAHKASFGAVCAFLGKDLSAITLDQFEALRTDPGLRDQKRLRGRFNSAVYMARKYVDELQAPAPVAAPKVAEVLNSIDRLRPQFGKRRYRKPAYKTAIRILTEAAADIRKLLRAAERQGENTAGWTIAQLQASAGHSKGFHKVRRAVGLLAGRRDECGMPVLGDNGKSEETPGVAITSPQAAAPAPQAAAPAPQARMPAPQAAQPAVAPVEPPPAPRFEAEATAPPVLDEVRFAGVPLDSLSVFDRGLSLEENYRRLYRAYTQVDGQRARAQTKVDRLVEVVKQLSDLAR